MIINPSTGLFDASPRIFEEGRGLNVSYVYAEYPNGTIVDVTEKYTDTGTLRILVTRDDGKPAEGAAVEITAST